MHTFLRAKYDDLDDPVDSVLYGPSTQNKIERWWRELLDRMEIMTHVIKQTGIIYISYE